jgi:hypothetical protein
MYIHPQTHPRLLLFAFLLSVVVVAAFKRGLFEAADRPPFLLDACLLKHVS